MKKHFVVAFALCFGFVVACKKDDIVSDYPLDIPLETVDSVSIDSLPSSTEKSTVNVNVPLTNFKHVWQNYLPTQWKTAPFVTSGYGYIYSCNYPMYYGNLQYSSVSNSNLCGIASYLMGVQLVDHPVAMDLVEGTNGKAIRLLECANRYKLFDSNYNFGDFCYIDKIRQMGAGTSTKKGDLTDWSNCSSFTGSGTTWGGSSSASAVRTFFVNKITAGKPCVALIKIRSQYQNANNVNYVSTGSLGTGHMVLVTGITVNSSGTGTVRFKDPWPNSSQTFEVSLTKFLSSMAAASSSGIHNAFSINGV